MTRILSHLWVSTHMTGIFPKELTRIDSYKAGMKEIQSRYPGCKAVASVLRNMYTAEDGDWLGIYLKDGVFYESPVTQSTQL